MKIHSLLWTFTLVVSSALSGHVFAQDVFPSRQIRVIVPQGAGGPGDTNARIFADRMSRVLQQPIVIENRVGGSTIVGAEAVATSPPDGYTMLFASVTTLAVNTSLFAKLPYDPVKDFVPIAMVTSQPFFLIANPNLPANNVKELVALAKKSPGKLNYGSSGAGTSGHTTGAFFASETGINIVHVPYKTAGAVQVDLIAGRVDISFRAIDGTLLASIKAGQIKVLGTTGAARSPLMPEVPTIAEQGVPGFESSVWSGFVVPKGTPPAVVNKLSSTILQIAQEPEVKQRVAANGGESTMMGPVEFASLIKTETVKWGKVVKGAGIIPE